MNHESRNPSCDLVEEIERTFLLQCDGILSPPREGFFLSCCFFDINRRPAPSLALVLLPPADVAVKKKIHTHAQEGRKAQEADEETSRCQARPGTREQERAGLVFCRGCCGCRSLSKLVTPLTFEVLFRFLSRSRDLDAAVSALSLSLCC